MRLASMTSRLCMPIARVFEGNLRRYYVLQGVALKMRAWCFARPGEKNIKHRQMKCFGEK